MNTPKSPSPQAWIALLTAASHYADRKLEDDAVWVDLERAVRENQLPVDQELLKLAHPEIATACRLLVPGLVAEFVGEHQEEIRAMLVVCRE
jgi:hypothetical protein